jgi:DTW domain-containing protein YfiP
MTDNAVLQLRAERLARATRPFLAVATVFAAVSAACCR